MSVSIEVYAAQVAANLNRVGRAASKLSFPGDAPERFRIAWALLRLTFDHAAAMSSLFHHHGTDLAGPPFALLRPMNEAFKRGTWFALCATDEETQTFIDSDVLPKKRLAEEIEKHEPFSNFPMFTEQHKAAWEKFHSFTHGGIQMVAAYTLGHGIGPAFPEEDIKKVLDHAEAVAIMAAQVMVMIAGEHEALVANGVLDDLQDIVPTRQLVGQL